jgi:hypothetical protein
MVTFFCSASSNSVLGLFQSNTNKSFGGEQNFTEIPIIRFDQSKKNPKEIAKSITKKMEQYEEAQTNDEGLLTICLIDAIFLDNSWLNRLGTPIEKNVSTKRLSSHYGSSLSSSTLSLLLLNF